MIIHSNENNTSALKLLICAKLVKENVQLRIGNAADNAAQSLKQLPILEVSPELKFFSSNAACLYLVPAANSTDKLQSAQWLEWEATKLLPNVANLGTSKSSKEVVSRLATLIEELNTALGGKDFLLGKSVSAIDICIWCTLYSLSSDANLAKQYLSNAPNLKKWQEQITGLKEVQESLKEYSIKSTDICQALNAASISGGYVISSQSTAAPQNETSNSPAAGMSPEQKPEVAVTPEELVLAQEGWINGGKKLGKALPDEKIVLPKDGYRNILITSALPYVNNVPHLGNIIGCVLSADVFARYCRLCSYNTLFVCGTDEYGTATETKALEERITPREICDKYFEIHNAVYRWFGIGFDYFGRTTTPEQTEIAQEMFQSLHKNGFVDTQTVEQLLCEKCNRFLADRFVEGGCPHPGCGYEDARGDQCDGCGKLINAPELINPRCKICSTKPVLRTSSHFFLDLPQLEPLLQVWVSSSENGWSNSAQQITRAWLKTGLRSRCITRDLDWGVQVPMKGFESKVFYVWFDAPIGYISITKRYTDQYEKWWKPDPKHNVTLYQFMAKDNVPFHSVVFPATLLGIGQKHVMVKHIMATEYLNYEDGKFSKSRGVGVFGTDAQDTGIPSDIFRFYLLSIRPEGQDSNFSWLDMATRNNSELLNNLGNFVNRASVFCANSFKGTIPQMHLEAGDYNLLALVNREIKGYMESLELSKQRDALRHVLNISRHGNQFMQAQQPWVLLKGTDDAKTRAGTVVGLSCNMSCLLGVLLSPFMPQTARTLLGQLGTNLDTVGKLNFEYPCFRILLPPGHKIGTPSPLFDKIELAKVEELKKRYAGRQASPPKEVIKVDGLSTQELDALILKQGEKVRQLKSSGVEKAVWQPEVEVLLALKKKLAQAPTVIKQEAGGQTVAEIEAEIAKQGDKVRQLKSSKVDKSVWQPEVDALLALKKKLTLAQQTNQESGDTKSDDVKTVAQLEAEIAKQGEKVRQLKTSGAEKAVWQPEVSILLTMKDTLLKLNPAAALNSPTDSKKVKKGGNKN